jgi:hypothetical protein
MDIRKTKRRGLMRKNLMRIAFVVIGFCVVMFACAQNTVGVGLVNYVNHGILNIADYEKMALERYASVTGENYTTDQAVYDALKDYVIPGYERFLQGLENIRPEEEEIRKLHGFYLRGTEALLEGFKIKMAGIEKKDEGIIIMGNRRIEEGRMETERWLKGLMDLYSKYGVGQKGKKEEKK